MAAVVWREVLQLPQHSPAKMKIFIIWIEWHIDGGQLTLYGDRSNGFSAQPASAAPAQAPTVVMPNFRNLAAIVNHENKLKWKWHIKIENQTNGFAAITVASCELIHGCNKINVNICVSHLKINERKFLCSFISVKILWIQLFYRLSYDSVFVDVHLTQKRMNSISKWIDEKKRTPNLLSENVHFICADTRLSALGEKISVGRYYWSRIWQCSQPKRDFSIFTL